MELEELKASWNILNERLQQNEILNRRIVKEMISKRTMVARDRLLKMNVGGAIFILLIAIIIIITRGRVVVRPEAEIITWAGLSFTLAYLFYSIYFLSCFNMEKCSLAELSRWTIKLRRMLRMELLVAPLAGLIMLVVIFFVHHHYRSIQQMIFDLVIVLLVGVASYCGYKFIDKRSVDEIEKGLEELKEFEEE